MCRCWLVSYLILRSRLSHILEGDMPILSFINQSLQSMESGSLWQICIQFIELKKKFCLFPKTTILVNLLLSHYLEKLTYLQHNPFPLFRGEGVWYEEKAFYCFKRCRHLQTNVLQNKSLFYYGGPSMRTINLLPRQLPIKRMPSSPHLFPEH